MTHCFADKSKSAAMLSLMMEKAMRVQVQERVDDKTVLCSVSWDQPSSTNTIRFLVRVPASRHEFSVEAGAEIMPAALRSMALLKARDAADAFSNLVSETL
jgi:hypothetical protein